MTEKASSIEAEEVARFNAMAEAWWDKEGSFAPLHALNPVRIAYIRDCLERHFKAPPEKLRLLDIGCGGGLLCEPMAELGLKVSGIDAGEKNIKIAQAHAEKSGLDITYRQAAAEDLAGKEAPFDVVLAMEIVEHVADLPLFMKSCCALVKPGGLLFLATLNRTLKAYGLAIIGAEYVLGWLPKGTHQWEKFVKPSELDSLLREGGTTIRDLKGVSYNPLSREWKTSEDVAVNYMLCATRETPA